MNQAILDLRIRRSAEKLGSTIATTCKNSAEFLRKQKFTLYSLAITISLDLITA